MTKSIWINLPVKDVQRSQSFFTSLGFTLNEHYGNNSNSASLLVGDNKVVLMLFAETTFKKFTGIDINDTQHSSEVLFSIDAESREEVDELARKAQEAGGFVYAQPGENQGWMYGCGFADLDGHRWNVLHMDLTKMPR